MRTNFNRFRIWAAGRVLCYSPLSGNRVSQAAGRGFACRPACAAAHRFRPAGAAAAPPAA